MPTEKTRILNCFVSFRFDRARFSTLNHVHQKVVHHHGNKFSFTSFDEDLLFMQRAGLHVFAMRGDRIGLCINVTETFRALAEFDAPPEQAFLFKSAYANLDMCERSG